MKNPVAVIAGFLLISLCIPFSGISLNYYWVGGSGNWNDINHWATTSGGGIYHTSPPSAFDDVFFDANSGFTPGNNTVTVNISADCRSMSWSGGWASNPTLAGSNVLNIYGSLTLHPALNMTFSGAWEFEATTGGWTINMADIVVAGDIRMNGTGGGWTFQDSVMTMADFELVNGNVNTNSFALRCQGFNSYNTNNRTITFGSSPVRIYYRVYLNHTNLTWNYNTSSFYFYATNGNIPVAGQTLAFYNLYTVPSNGTFTADKMLNITNNAVFNNNATFNGNTNTFSSITITSGKTYLFPAGGSNTITGTFTQAGPSNCASITQVKSTSQGSASTITKASGSVTLNYTVISDLTATGGATFTVNNAINMGNNSGWTINATLPRTLYWVGGAGNWNSQAHWSLSSGGPGGECIPSFQDDVNFDANSGFTPGNNTVTININADCRNMTWAGGWGTNPALSGSSTLNIYGSVVLHNTMTVPFSGAWEFEATTPGWNINMADQTVSGDIFMNGNGGGWTFQDSVMTTADFELVNGNVNTNNFALRCQGFNSYNTNNRTITFGSSPVRIYYRVYLNHTNLTWNYNTSSFYFYATNGNIPVAGQTLAFYNLYTVPSNGTFTADKMLNITNNAVFNNNATFNGNTNTFHNISIAAGKTYTFSAGGNSTITGTVSQGGLPGCANITNLQSSQLNVATTITKASGNVTLNYVAIQDMTATGGATFVINNAINFGNNTGWTINSGLPRTLYWVGGAGNWDSQAHWSLSSGGAGGECIPSFQDDVNFDANSGFTPGNNTVTININADCRNMTWAGGWGTAPVLAGNMLMNIYGSVQLDPSMTVPFSGRWEFEATTPGWNINMADQTVSGDIFMNGNGGGWTFQDSVMTTADFELVNGNVNTNNFALRCQGFNSYNTNNRTITFGSSPVRIYYRVYLNHTNLTWNYNTSSFYFYATNGNIPVAGQTLSFYNLYTVPSNGTFTADKMLNITNDAVFNNSATFNGATNTFQNITISAGKTYAFPDGGTSTINGTFTGMGNPCNIIMLISTDPGTFSTLVTGPNDTLYTDYCNIQDIHATGGTYYAGGNSNDYGNNTGWVFGNYPGYIFGLGNDTVLGCNQYPYLLTTQNFNPGPGTTYLWNNGSTNDFLIAPDSGTYTIEVTYDVNCVIWDTIHLMKPVSNIFVSGNDTALCGPGTVVLNASSNGSVTWKDMSGNILSTGSSTYNTGVLTVNTSYIITADDPNSGCPAQTSDTINVVINSLPQVTLSTLNEVCENQASFTLSGGSPAGGTYSGTGVSNGMFNPAAAGLGTHTITYSYTDGNGCTAQAQQTIQVSACLGTNPQENITILLFPNPVQQFLSVQFSGIETLKVTLTDMSGKQHWQKEIKGNTQIDVSELAAGIYLVNCGGKVFKIVKE